jgi:hypothetical protein
MGRVDPLSAPFVLQTGPTPATNDPDYGPKTLQIEKFCRKIAGQAQKRKLKALFSIVSLSHSMRGTSLGQQWDKGQAGHEKFF